MNTSFDELNKMDTDILLMTFERLLEQEYQKILEYGKINNKVK